MPACLPPSVRYFIIVVFEGSLRPQHRETTLMTTNDLQGLSTDVNMKLEEVNVLYLRFKMLEPSPSGLVSVTSFSQKNGTPHGLLTSPT